MTVSYDTKPTQQYSTFQAAYDYFDAHLFGRELPPCMITLNRKPNCRGYFSPDRFKHRGQGQTTHEIALNPDVFSSCTDREILSTLVHEMVHLWQQEHGRPGKSTYHNQEWADRMKELGLQPTDTGEVGGKEVGHKMTHLIVDGGPFDALTQRLLAEGFSLDWQSAAPVAGAPKKKDRIKYTCPVCGTNLWAKPGVHVACVECDEEFQSDQPEPD